VDLHGLQGDNLPHHGLYHELEGKSLCSDIWGTSSPLLLHWPWCLLNFQSKISKCVDTICKYNTSLNMVVYAIDHWTQASGYSATEVGVMKFLLDEFSKSSPWPVFIIAEWGMPGLSHIVQYMIIKQSVQ